ncbi:endodeoxyribonuclease [[Clostridium] sordellii]|nr:endodeoxyribonuclease [[Clostridium] sordellii] [Paeniclostridium sordellii]
MKINFIIDGKPQGKGRPRLSYGRIKTPEQTVMYENYIKLLYRAQVKMYFEGPIKMAIN